ncbi:MAG: hypothetical protein C5B59_10760 [Bacteroidetes bacterium]|nr:MAG: hypothetical protein C5B59_10760 [Bacteroidota bacterium]
MQVSKLFTQLIIAAVGISTSYGQSTKNWIAEKMPPALETEYALSSLPPRLRDAASVYLLDPEKGYYLARKGTNGFTVFVIRTQIEEEDFFRDSYMSISFDEEGAKTFVPMYFDVAAMRATGKYSLKQIRDTVLQRMKDGTYKAPSRTGISYMLCPLNRVPKGGTFINDVMPHYMIYAPRVDDKDIGGAWDGGQSPFTVDSGLTLDKEHSIFNLIIVPAGNTEKANIIAQNKDLLDKLAAYKPYFKVNMATAMEHHH